MAHLPICCNMVSIVTLRRAGPHVQALLLRRTGPYLRGTWSYAAGHVEPGEAGWQAALRELREETGLTPEALYATSFCEQFYLPGEDCMMLVPAFVAWIDDQQTVTLDAEHDAHRWLDFDEAVDALPFGSQRDLYAHVRREFIQRTPTPALRIEMKHEYSA